jgi:hypothetical protein
VLNFVVCLNTIDLVLVAHLIFDDMLPFGFSCLYHTLRRTVRYIYKTVGMIGKRETIAAVFFFEYCDNRVHMRVSDIEQRQIMMKSTLIFRVLIIEI